MNKRHLALLAIITWVAIMAAMLVTREDEPKIAGRGEPLFPGLLARANDIREIEVRKGNDRVTLVGESGMWTVSEAQSYRASPEKVRKMVLGMAELTIVEPKTDNPALHEKLGLDDPTQTGARASAITLSGADGAPLAQLVIGRTRPARGDRFLSEYYVRKADGPETWLVTGNLITDVRAESWLDTPILGLDEARLRQVTVKHADGETLRVEKASAADRNFTIAGIKPEEHTGSEFAVNNIARSLAGLRFSEVEPASTAAAAKGDALVITAETFDGLVVTTSATKADEDNYQLRVQASVAAQPPAQEQPATAAEGGAAPSPAPAAPDRTDLEQEVSDLNGWWSNWVYLVPESRMANIAKRRADLVEPELPD